MIPRLLAPRLTALARQFPVVCVTGPRQSGKTTLCRRMFPERAYVSLEAPDVRARATSDARGFLADLPDGAVLDEIQRVPDLSSWLQVDVDERRVPGRWIVTGSANFALLESVSQSLAGRAAILTLLPLSAAELPPTGDLWETLVRGGYPAIHQHGLAAADWLSAYAATYLERDVRQVLRVGDLVTFETFLGLCAGRAGQVLNLAALGADAGVSSNTAKAWLGVLETSWVVHRVGPWAGSLTTRLVKSPKLHFVDSGLHAWLLGVRDPSHLRVHPLRGGVFESWVASEILKARANAGLPGDLFFFRDHKGLEIDLLVGRGLEKYAVEVKSGATVGSDWFAGLARAADLLSRANPPVKLRPVIVYGGDRREHRGGVDVVPWREIGSVDWGAV